MLTLLLVLITKDVGQDVVVDTNPPKYSWMLQFQIPYSNQACTPARYSLKRTDINARDSCLCSLAAGLVLQICPHSQVIHSTKKVKRYAQSILKRK